MKNYWFMSGAVVNNQLYIFTEEDGDLIKIDIESYKAEYVYLEKRMALPGSTVVYADNDYIYSILARGEYLLKYSVTNGIGERFYLGLEHKMMNLPASVLKAGDELVIVPMRSNRIVHINTITGEAADDVVEDSTYREGELFFAKCCETDGNYMWLFSNSTKEVIRYNALTKEKIYYAYPKDITWVADAEIWRDSFYILDALGNVISWKIGFPTDVVLRNPHGEIELDVSTLHIAGGKIWLMPSYGNEIICFDIKSGKYKVQEYYPNGFSYTAPKGMAKYPQKIQTNQRCFFSMHAGNYVFYIDQVTGEGSWADIIWPNNEETIKYMLSKYENFGCEGELSLALFCKHMRSSQKLTGTEKTIGRNLWNACINDR